MATALIISDTHVREYEELPIDLQKEIEKDEINSIFHLGDFFGDELYNSIKERCQNFYAVNGNNDFFIKTPLEEQLIVDFEGIKIGLMHGTGRHSTTTERVLNTFANYNLDILMHGHTHTHYIKEYEPGKYILNPGSITIPVWGSEYNALKLEVLDTGAFKFIPHYFG